MRRKRFSDFDEFAGSVQDVDCRMLLRNAERREWTIDGVEIDSIDVQLGRLGSGNIAQGSVRTDGYLFYAPLTGGIEYTANGCVVDMNSCVVMEPGSEFCISTKDAHDWAAVFLPKTFCQERGLAFQLPFDAETSQCRVTHPNHGAASYFRASVIEVLSTASALPQFEASVAAKRAAEEVFRSVAAFADWMPRETNREGRPRVPREEIIRLSLEYVERNDNEPVRIGDLSEAAGVSERTLRAIFHEYYGIGPIRYLQLRRLHRVRRALKAAEAETTSVGQVLIDHGEWAFSRFASRYQRLFGESPSQTLKSK